MRKQARAGGDPLAERRNARRVVPSFEQAARTVHEAHKAAWRNPKHRDQWINTLRDFVFPELGAKPVDRIDSADVLKVLSPIWLGKPETARRVKQRIKTVLDWARAQHYRSGENPVEGVAKALPKQPRKTGHHAAWPYEQVPAFVTLLRASAADEVVRLAFEFMILTAARTGEVLGAHLDEIDLDAKLWTVPACSHEGWR